MARKMKDSGIEWIGEIPTDFSLYKLKYLLSSPLCYGANESGTLYSDILPRYIRITDISPNGTLKNSGMLSLDESSAQNYMLHEGDILFARSGATVGKSFIYHNYYGRAAYAGYLIKASFNRLVLPEFVYYYTCSSAYEIWKNSIFIQSTIQNIGADRYSNLPISVPNSIDKQLRIVRYLNNFCSKFDAIIYNLQTSIEDYKKLKQAVITRAVTKGVRGEREMKDSGNPWFGQIPTDWKLSRVGLHFSIILGKMLCNAPLNDTYTLEPYYCAADVHFDGVADGERKKMWFSPIEKDLYRVSVGDLLVVEGGAGAGGSAIVEKQDSETYVQNSIMIVRSKGNADSRYLRYLLEFLVKQGYIDIVCNKATIPHFTKDKLSCVPFCLCPTGEQEEIADYLDAKCAEIDRLIAKKEQLVKELESYRKSLIYEVVTGKREV